MSSASRGLAPREGLGSVLMKIGRAGPPFEPRHRPQAGKSGDPRSQNADMVVCSKHQGYHSDTSNEAHNPLGLSVEKHSNNFIVSNDVLVLEVCKRCTDVVIVKNLTRVSPW